MNTQQLEEINGYLADKAPQIMKEIQADLYQLNDFAGRIRMESWPKEIGWSFPIASESEDQEVKKVKLKSAAIQSPLICLEELESQIAKDNIVELTKRILRMNLNHLWNSAFARDIILHTEHKELVKPRKHRPATYLTGVSFFGRSVNAYVTRDAVHGIRYEINPKFKRVAHRLIRFDPDAVHFLFPDVEKWAGDCRWYNIPDSETNPDGVFGQFRVVMQYADKPVQTDLGSVLTVAPNLPWYYAWKLVGK